VPGGNAPVGGVTVEDVIDEGRQLGPDEWEPLPEVSIDGNRDGQGHYEGDSEGEKNTLQGECGENQLVQDCCDEQEGDFRTENNCRKDEENNCPPLTGKTEPRIGRGW